MKTKFEDFEVVVPPVDENSLEQRIKVQIPLEWDEDFESWVIGDKAQRIIDDTKAHAMGLILPDQMKALRDRIGYTQKQMGELFQVGGKSWTRWETGRHRPSRVISLLIRALYDGEISLDYLLERAGKKSKRKESKSASLASLYASLQSEAASDFPQEATSSWISCLLDPSHQSQALCRSFYTLLSRHFNRLLESKKDSAGDTHLKWERIVHVLNTHEDEVKTWTHAMRPGSSDAHFGFFTYREANQLERNRLVGISCFPSSRIEPIREPSNIG